MKRIDIMSKEEIKNILEFPDVCCFSTCANCAYKDYDHQTDCNICVNRYLMSEVPSRISTIHTGEQLDKVFNTFIAFCNGQSDCNNCKYHKNGTTSLYCFREYLKEGVDNE